MHVDLLWPYLFVLQQMNKLLDAFGTYINDILVIFEDPFCIFRDAILFDYADKNIGCQSNIAYLAVICLPPSSQELRLSLPDFPTAKGQTLKVVWVLCAASLPAALLQPCSIWILLLP